LQERLPFSHRELKKNKAGKPESSRFRNPLVSAKFADADEP
jgi:hypothetical protein